MAPIRRYLRISKYSVLECRIYLDNPSLGPSWLLNPRNPMLPKVIESIRPLVLPKLREEKERAKKKSSKKKTVKDVVVQDEFEVSIFLTETSTRHSLLYKSKHFREKLPPKMESNSNKLISETDNVAVDVDAGDGIVLVLREEDEDKVGLSAIPLAEPGRRSKRQRIASAGEDDGFSPSDEDETASAIEIDSDTEAPPHKRQRARRLGSDDDDEADGLDGNDDKKKLAMDVSYDGFAIYGRVLCLVVKKLDTPGTNKARQPRAAGIATGSSNSNKPEGQAVMENWITSTQIPVGEEEMP